jgi:hypothetical protein
MAPERKDGAGAGSPAGKPGDIDLARDAEAGFDAAESFIVLDDPKPPAAAPAPPAKVAPPPSVPALIDDRPAAPPAPRAAAPRPGPAYDDQPPSMAPDHVREPVALPKWAEQTRGRPAGPPKWIRPLLLLAAGLGVALAAHWAYGRFRPTPPVISSVMPPKAEPGQTVTINGTALGADASAVVVRFGDRRGAVTSASDTSLAATVPADLADAPPGDVRVTVEVEGRESNALFMALARFPRVASVVPEVALPGDEIALTGSNLDLASAAVRVGGVAATVVAAERDRLRVKVPDLPVVEGKAVPVEVTVGRETARPGSLILGHLPLVTGISPKSAQAGATVTISGYGFGMVAEGITVTFGSQEALVLAASAREVKAVVPAAGLFSSQQALPVTVAVAGGRSAPREFNVARASGDVFRPRFAAAPPPPGGDPARHAVVETELGPVLLLTGRADAASVAARADRTAAALNAALTAAVAQPLAIAARDGQPPVVLAGDTPIVAATAEDAETLSRGFAGVTGAATTPRRLAEYWAALLNDYVGLFARRQRPNGIVDLTPRARVLLDIYADAERRGGSAGVGQRIAVDSAAARAEPLRQLAFAAPPPAAASGLPLAGTWDGTVDDAGATRRVRVAIRAGDGRLAGTITSSAGNISMGIPLEDLRYDRGMVRFTAVVRGAARRFEGKLEGGVIAGTVDGGTPGAGRFTLRHVE